MKLLKVKAESAGRILNIWKKAYTFDKDGLCLIPENEANWLPLTYKIIWEITSTKEVIPAEEIPAKAEEVEIKKVIKEKIDTKKVVEQKIDIKKTEEIPAKAEEVEKVDTKVIDIKTDSKIEEVKKVNKKVAPKK